MILGHAAVVEDQLCLVRVAGECALVAPDREPGRVARHQEGRDAAVRALLLVGHREHHGDVSPGAVRDEVFRAVDDPLGAVELRARGDGLRVGARAGFGEREAHRGLAAYERLHELPAQVLGKVHEDRRRRLRVWRTEHERRESQAALRHLLDEQRVAERGEVLAADRLRHVRAVQPELGGAAAELHPLLAHLLAEHVVLQRLRIPLLDRTDLAIEERAERGEQVGVVLRDGEVHVLTAPYSMGRIR